MRIEPFGVGSVVHVVKRGARGMEIVKSKEDKLYFALQLRHLNDMFKSEHWDRQLIADAPFERPEIWPAAQPLVRILAWTLLPNHFHLILQEIREGGVSKFMQKLCNSMSQHFNATYNEKGSIFQGAYKSRTVTDDAYLRYVVPYVVLKNTLELFPGGLIRAQKDFDAAWEWALRYPYTSLASFGNEDPYHIVAHEDNIVRDIFPTMESIKQAGLDMLIAHIQKRDDEFAPFLTEVW